MREILLLKAEELTPDYARSPCCADEGYMLYKLEHQLSLLKMDAGLLEFRMPSV